jgi:glycosyltransferase involved in cell wall biosynthesis
MTEHSGSSIGRMRILILAGWYPNEDDDLAGIFIRDQAKALRSVCDVSVLYVHLGRASSPPSASHEEGLTVVRVGVAVVPNPAAGSAHIRNLVALTVGYCRAVLSGYEALRSAWGRPDLIHAHVFYPSGVGAWLLRALRGVPYVVTEHSSECLPGDGGFWRNRGRLIRALVRRSGRRSSGVIAVSSSLGRALVSCGLTSSFEVVPNVVRPARSPQPTPARRCLQIAHVSTLTDYSKNVSGLLRAVSALSARRHDFRLAIAGDGPDGAQLRVLAASLGLTSDVVTFLGRIPPRNVADLMAGSDFLVVSSRFETFSVVAAESLACGRPVLSTRCGGPEDYLTPDLGYLVAVDDERALEAGIDHMLDHAAEYEPEHLARRAAGMFASGVVAATLEGIYRRVLGSRGGGS